MTPEQKEQCGVILAHFGLMPQIRKTREELGELMEELQQPINFDRVASEIADVKIMVEQIEQAAQIKEQVEAEIDYKLLRTKERVACDFYSSNKVVG